MTGKISHGRARRAFRQDAEQAAKLFAVQEQQIAALQAEIDALKTENAVLNAVLLGVGELYVWDHVDQATGEVYKKWQMS
ncbi:MAG: hypothetical protein KC441_00960 [Anaerolineales bacterium]|nr:hypothetical protein [Anaerolineales bacterium]